jgi:hypothetical protein
MRTIEYRERKYLSVSTLVDFMRCPRRYFYKKCGLTRGTGSFESPAPKFGTAMHRAVPLILATDNFDLAWEAFCDEWEEYEAEVVEREGGLPASMKAKNMKVAERILKHFQHTRSGRKSIYKLLMPDFTNPIEAADKNSDYEIPWMVDIGLRVPLVGRFDGFCQHRDTGETWIWELKTTSRLNSSFFEAHELFTQNFTYMLVASTIMQRDVKGVILEGVLTDPKKVDNQTHPLPIESHHMEDILRLLQKSGTRLLEMEDAITAGIDPAEAFYKDFCGCSPYTHHYIPTTFRCEYDMLCKAPHWSDMAPFYSIQPEHDFLQLSVGESD